MASLGTRTSLAIYSTLFVANAIAQSTGACGSSISASREYYEIRFDSYCNTRLINTNTQPPIQRSTFRDCSIACVDQGPTCGGFAFDRNSRYGQNNCYLNKAYSQPIAAASDPQNTDFDSAVVDNSSLPITRRDCTTLGSGTSRYTGRCGEAIYDGSSRGNIGNQLRTVFASSLADCVDHCSNITSDTGTELCQAVTWDPTLLYGYQNCYLKGAGYVEPVINAAWDSATLDGTTGFAINPNVTSSSTSSRSSSTPSTSSRSSSSLSATRTTTTTTTSANPNNAPSSSHRLHSAEIAGIACGIALLVAIAILLAFALTARRRRHKAASASSGVAANPPPVDPNRPQVGEVPTLPPVSFHGPNNGRVFPRSDGKGKGKEVEVDEAVIAGPSKIRYA